MATINLGAIKFNWKGAYNSGTSYAVDDVVSSGGNSYVCIQAHSNQAVGNATAYWNIMSSAGTNGTDGTDLGTTLTTQGDILYRDGSGLQRLGAGTSGQVLQTSGTGANPSWTNQAEGGLVHLATTDVTSAGGYVSFNNIFTTDYDYYRCHWSNMNNTSGGYSLIAYLTDNAGSQLGAGQYETVGGASWGNSGGSGYFSDRAWAANYIKINSSGNISNSVPCSGYIDISNPRDSGYRTTYTSDHFYHDGVYHLRGWSGGCLANSVEVYGIEFSVTGGAINTNSVFSVFGYKKS